MGFMAALPAITAGAGLLGKIMGGAGKGSADQRMTENQQRLQQSSIQNQDALQRAMLEMQQKQFQQNEPGAQARQAMVGSLLQRLKPIQMSGLSERVQGRMPQMTSMLDALGPEARNAGGMLAQRGTSGLQAGPSPFSQLPPAQMAALQKSGLLEKLLGAGGLGGSILGGLGELGDLQSLGQRPEQYGAVDRTPPIGPRRT